MVQSYTERANRDEKGILCMAANPDSEDPKSKPTPAVEHVEGAHDLLKVLRARIGEHPELSEAITRLEMALSALTVRTGGML
jgi:hypothetical protein